MNNIIKKPVNSLGYHFIPEQYLPANENEYYIRDSQNRSGISYRKLTAYEIEVLVRNRNTSDDWNGILVSDAFNPELVKNCKFFGLVRIGKLEPYYLEFNNLRVPVGLYNSTVISCDLGDNVAIDNVNYISHYIVGNDVIIVNVNELATTDYAKFGNGILKEGELEKNRIWMEICNENGGRRIIPFNDMMPGDAWLWSRFRDDAILQQKLTSFTQEKFDVKRGYYGKIGDRTVIKNTAIIKDVLIGSDAYIKGANKLKNLTIKSAPDAKTQIGEGCELVNGIVGLGCRVFYGVKAVRFIMASNSQLKYGARLINSYLGDNATISCCEVLNSLIFPGHEQHHNNSFLCAALVMGQSNMAAGTTIGSNHNSRSADGEMEAGRGFWPGLCVSIKHNSKFASFAILAKGDYPAELNIPFPFSLLINDAAKDQLNIMPGYWFMYNMYALSRNAWKYVDRDKRIKKTQQIEFDFLAPDSINEMITALGLLKKFTGKAFYKQSGKEGSVTEEQLSLKGEQLLKSNDPLLNELEILADGIENSGRKVVLLKVAKAYHLFKELIQYHAAHQLLQYIVAHKIKDTTSLLEALPVKLTRLDWYNAGGQLIPRVEVHKLVKQIRSGAVKSWDEIHDFYQLHSEQYSYQKLVHALAAAKEVNGLQLRKDSATTLNNLFRQAVATKEYLTGNIFESRAKDHRNKFRLMMYDSQEEMDKVIGKLDDNSFINQEKEALKQFKRTVSRFKWH
ncbi:MAG: DUF4954 family protein [Chitinophagaceae bacterium]|nr:DUF4954 family protein [Chitinophagaceae bacterium]